MIKSAIIGTLLAASAGSATLAWAADTSIDDRTRIVTASNTTANDLLVYSATGTLLATIPTQGQGGVSGNAGGIAADHGRLAVVNFGSVNVSIFDRVDGAGEFRLAQLVPAVSHPVSVAFGQRHLYILSTTNIESHAIAADGSISAQPDGIGSLVKADGSAAQVGVVDGHLIISEKSNAIETIDVNAYGAVAGGIALVAGIPANVNAPFGLATRGNDAYVTIAHANEISLVRDGAVLTITGSGTQNAPCWVALDGPFLFSSNSPSKSVSRYAVYGRHIIQDAAVVARFDGDPTDIAYRAGLAAVVDANATESHLSIFRVDEDGNFTPRASVPIAVKAANGVAILRPTEDEDGGSY